LELLVRLRRGLAALDALGGEHMHVLPAEAWRRPERGQLAPLRAGQAALLLQLSPSGGKRLLATLGSSRRELEKPTAVRLAQPRQGRDVPLVVDGDEGDRSGMLDDLAFVLAPPLDGDAEEAALP